VSAGGGASRSVNNISASTLLKGPLTDANAMGRVYSFNVTTAGAAGAIYDSSTVAGVAAGKLIAVIPAVVGVYNFTEGYPFNEGLVVAPGAAQVVSVSFR
jgi:hypothetical protein